MQEPVIQMHPMYYQQYPMPYPSGAAIDPNYHMFPPYQSHHDVRVKPTAEDYGLQQLKMKQKQKSEEQNYEPTQPPIMHLRHHSSVNLPASRAPRQYIPHQSYATYHGERSNVPVDWQHTQFSRYTPHAFTHSQPQDMLDNPMEMHRKQPHYIAVANGASFVPISNPPENTMYVQSGVDQMRSMATQQHELLISSP